VPAQYDPRLPPACQGLAVGADDLDLLSGGLAFRYARPGDSFVALGDAAATDDPPKPGEVVYADRERPRISVSLSGA